MSEVSVLPETDDPPRPSNVIEALAAVMRDLPGIGKDAESPQGYRYRGIEAITAHAQQLLGRYGVVYVPRVVSRSIVDIEVNSKPWTDTILSVEYDIYGPGGVDDRIMAGPVIGIGRDNSDKGANKAMTQAYKYALIQTLCIGDHKDEPDSLPAAEADTRAAVADPEKQARTEAARRVKALPDPQRTKIAERIDEQGMGRVAARWDDDQLARVVGWLDELESAAEEVAAQEAQADVRSDDGAEVPEAPDTTTSDESSGQGEGGKVDSSKPLPSVEDVEALIGDFSEATPQEEVRALLGDMTNDELRVGLQHRGLKITGNKPELVDRLAKWFAAPAGADE